MVIDRLTKTKLNNLIETLVIKILNILSLA